MSKGSMPCIRETAYEPVCYNPVHRIDGILYTRQRAAWSFFVINSLFLHKAGRGIEKKV